MDRKWMTADPTEYELLKENAKNNRRNMTEAESVFWSLVKGSSFGQRCLRQHIIGDYIVDFLFRKSKLIVEIDGGYHCRRTWYDTKRDSAFEQHGFATIRIKNRDVFVNVAFWQRLLEGLEKLHGDHPGIEQYIKELHRMIDSEIRSWTEIAPSTSTFDDDTVMEQTARMYNAMKAARRWRKKEDV